MHKARYAGDQRSLRPAGRLMPDHVGNRVLAAVMRNHDDYRHIWLPLSTGPENQNPVVHISNRETGIRLHSFVERHLTATGFHSDLLASGLLIELCCATSVT